MDASDRRLRRYLLGTLPPEEADAVELEYLGDAERFERVRAAEDALIDAWVRGDLGADEARAFEARAEARGWLERAGFARALAEVADLAPAPGLLVRLKAWLWPAGGARAWLRPLAAMAVALLVVGAVALSSSGPAGPAEIGLTLAPDSLRAEGAAPTLSLPPELARVRLRLSLDVPDELPAYAVTLTGGDGTGAPWSAADLRPDDAGALELAVPAERLTPGRYELAVTGDRDGVVVPIAFYTLRVVRADP